MLKFPFWYGLWGGLLSGLVGVAVDADHIFAYYGFTYMRGMWEFRPFHIPLAVIACGLGIYSVSCLRRLYHQMVLRKGERKDGTRHCSNGAKES